MNPEETETLVSYRLAQAQTALDDAKYLSEGQRSPQGIINRSCYAMFYAAIALLQEIGKIPSKHAGVISLFDTEFVKKGTFPKEPSKDFHRAFELRQVSDYRTTKLRQRAQSSMDDAALSRPLLLTIPSWTNNLGNSLWIQAFLDRDFAPPAATQPQPY
jgi:uncharacterized protein (UPF0332 family)